MNPDLKQQTDEWRLERYGCITGTRFGRVLGGYETRVRLIEELTRERAALDSGAVITFDDPDFPNGQHGRDMEHKAIAEYQLKFFLEDSMIKRPALVVYRKHKWIKFSPDFIESIEEGWNEYSRLGEVKCPVDPAEHLATMTRGMSVKHRAQTQGGMMVLGMQNAMFLSYHRAFKSSEQLYHQPLERDDSQISTLEAACFEILDHVKNGTIPKKITTSIPKCF